MGMLFVLDVLVVHFLGLNLLEAPATSQEVHEVLFELLRVLIEVRCRVGGEKGNLAKMAVRSAVILIAVCVEALLVAQFAPKLELFESFGLESVSKQP